MSNSQKSSPRYLSQTRIFKFAAFLFALAAMSVQLPALAATPDVVYTISLGQYITFSYSWVCNGQLGGFYNEPVTGTPYIGGHLTPYNGLTAMLSPNPGTSNVDTESLTVTAPYSAIPGTYSILVDGVGSPTGPCPTYTWPQFPQTLTLVVQGQPLTITSPAASANYQLTQQNYIQTPQIPFTAISSDTSAINWSLTLSYKTSGGRGRSSTSQSFTTQPSGTQNEQYTSIGGQLQAKATQGSATANVTITITGEPIPNATITSQLDSLYAGGATPNLLTGIATRESSYQQFDGTETLYGVTGYWPNESKSDGGSHIGLMMVPTTTDRAWDWTSNTSYGATLFHDKLRAAGRIARSIIRQNNGLPQLTPVQLENMALVLYGPYASSSHTMQYYIPDTSGSAPVWVVNTANNPNGVSYANSCRADVK